MENDSKFNYWLINLRALAVDFKLNSDSPWCERDMSTALKEDDLWLDYYAKGYTPQEAFDEANTFDASTYDPFEAELAEYAFNKKNKKD